MQKKFYFSLWAMFFVYIILLAYYTLFNAQFGRNIANILNLSGESMKEYLEYSFNIEPLKTIKLMFFAQKNGYVSFPYFFKNIFGNLLLLTPLAYFLPKLFKKINRFWEFLGVIVLVAFVIEALQLLFLTGCCDIDDLLLNTAGAAAVYPLTSFLIKREAKHNE